MERACFFLCATHLLGLAVTTYFAAEEIRSLLLTGGLCCISALVTGLSGMSIDRPWIAVGASFTPLTVAVLVVVGLTIPVNYQHGRSLVYSAFLINQTITLVTLLVQMSTLLSKSRKPRPQVTLKSLMLTLTIVSLFLAIARQFFVFKYDLLMNVSLGLLGLTFVGLTLVMISAAGERAAD